MKEKTNGFVAEFKEFISRGNVVDMAVGVIIGGAFTGIVNSLVNDMLMPLIGYVIGGIDFQDFKFMLPHATGTDPVYISYGLFIQAIINFLIIALVVFLFVKIINSFRKKEEKKAEEAPTAPAEDIVLLKEIRDLLKK